VIDVLDILKRTSGPTYFLLRHWCACYFKDYPKCNTSELSQS